MLKQFFFIILGIILISLVGSYTSPTYDSINFTLCSGYTSPTYDSINFTLALDDSCEIDTCTYTSGNWNVDCSDNCLITSNINLNGNNLSLSGIGNFKINANISNWANIILYDSNDCEIIINSGGFT